MATLIQLRFKKKKKKKHKKNPKTKSDRMMEAYEAETCAGQSVPNVRSKAAYAKRWDQFMDWCNTKRPGSLREERFVLYYLDHDQGMGQE